MRSVREETAELANYFLSNKKDVRGTPFLRRPSKAAWQDRTLSNPELGDTAAVEPETIDEVSEPPSPDATEEPGAASPSMLTTMFKRSPLDNRYLPLMKDDQAHEYSRSAEDSEDEGEDTLTRVSTTESRPLLAHHDTTEEASEESPLIAFRSRENRGDYGISHRNGHAADLEGQKHPSPRKWFGHPANSFGDTGGRVAAILHIISNPKRWDRRALWQNAVVAPVACLPAVVVGLLLNILDALSYGEHTQAPVTFGIH